VRNSGAGKFRNVMIYIKMKLTGMREAKRTFGIVGTL